MAWTAPMTAVANSVFTAAQFNTNVRDNLLETAPAKATASGRFIVTTGVNSIAEREISSALVSNNQTTTSTSYTDLTTAGPSVTVTTGTRALVFWKARMWNNTATNSTLMSVAVSGVTTIAADDTWSMCNTIGSTGLAEANSQMHLFDGTLTGGSNTFTCKYRVDGSTGNYIDRRITVIAL